MEMWGPGERERGWWVSEFVRNEPNSVYQGAGMKRLQNAGSRKISFEEIYRMFGIKEPKGTWPKWGSQRLEVRRHFFHCALRQNLWALFIISEHISKQALSHQFSGQRWNWQRMWTEVERLSLWRWVMRSRMLTGSHKALEKGA